MLRYKSTKSGTWSRSAAAGLAFFVFSIPAISSENQVKSDTSDDQSYLEQNVLEILSGSVSGANEAPMPILLNESDNGLTFDLGGSETRKLHLLIDSPVPPDALSPNFGSQLFSLPGRDASGLDATLNVPMGPALSLTGNVNQQQEQVQFQSLGSIQCTDGVLRPHSYTASGCRFIDEPYTGFDQSTFSLGAQYDTSLTTTSFSWFTSESDLTTSGGGQFSPIQPAFSNLDLLTPNFSNPLLAPSALNQPLGNFNGETSGVDLSFQLGLTSDSYGDVRLGLAYSRILDASFSSLYSNLDPVGWTTADDFDTARLDVEWNRGSFSGGIQGFYRDQVDFLHRESLDSFSTFDVHFTWRTPWNADLSVGASNILNSGVEEMDAPDTQSTDPFESIYGRIPYVRYKQDL